MLDVDYADADQVVLVWDNLNTHTPASLYKAFPPAEARRLLDRLEIHYTPKLGERTREGNDFYHEMMESNVLDKVALVYGQMNEPPGNRARVALTGLTMAEYFRDDGNWLNIAEIELSVLSKQCLNPPHPRSGNTSP